MDIFKRRTETIVPCPSNLLTDVQVVSKQVNSKNQPIGCANIFLAHSIPLVFFFSENYPIQCCFNGDDNNKVGENHQLTHRIPVATTVLNIAQSMC